MENYEKVLFYALIRQEGYEVHHAKTGLYSQQPHRDEKMKGCVTFSID